jgi:predicted 3-demethylubiquinone-9 3-methyltransferase (glyoxalase superfamily)
MRLQTRVQPFLMFHGQAEKAMNFYVSLLPGSEIFDIVLYGPGQAGTAMSGSSRTFRSRPALALRAESAGKHDPHPGDVAS